MNNFKDICQKFDSSVLQQLYKKVTDDDCKTVDKNVFPVTLVQSVFDAITGIRLDDILSHYNYINLQYKGTKELTRNAIPVAHRRKGLVIQYKDYDSNTVIEQYVGKNINDDDWQHEDNWKTPFTEGRFTVSVTDTQLEKYINQYFDSKDIGSVVTERVGDIIANYIASDEGRSVFITTISDAVSDYLREYMNDEYLNELITDIVKDKVNEYLVTYLNTDEGKDLILEVTKPYMDEQMNAFRDEVSAYLQDNERVIANALIRHEQWIQEHSK